ncbi:MAG: AMP-binding protein [Gammaproteobacteria bacterium]|nr:AMP-binding protein [Gammaproteobacteria bacterium]
MELPARFESLASTSGSAANYVPLTPTTFLSRTADVYGDLPSVCYGETQYTWRQTEQRVQSFARALLAMGLQPFDTVSVLAFNTPEMFEAHYAVPLAGGVLNTINTRLDADTISYIFERAETRFLLIDRELLPMAAMAIESCRARGQTLDIVIIDDPTAAAKPDVPADAYEFDVLLAKHHTARSDYLPAVVADELAPLAINFTSGTSGRPKGVVYHHRGAYLMAMGTVSGWAVPRHPSYLYLVPMFHCNGWCHAWTMTIMAAKVVCMRSVDPDAIFAAMQTHQVTHFGGAPIVLNMLANSPNKPARLNPDRVVQAMTAGAPPPASVLAKMADMGVEIMHVYGLTETYGHILQATPQPDWAEMDVQTEAELKARQGVRFPMTEQVGVIDEDGNEVVHDGETMGEIVIRGNVVMSGYLKDPAASEDSLKNGWFYSGDLAVVYPDGYIQVRDRAKDIIISGGENISSIEVEGALYKHPAVGEAAVVAMPDEKWGETPCAFVELKQDADASEQELIDHCAAQIARFKRPKKVVFGPLPKTATGKIQKFELRVKAKTLVS